MPDREDDLRAVSDAIKDDAARLHDLEASKSRLDPADPQVLDLSREIEALVEQTSIKATAERELSEEIADSESPA